MNYWKGSKDTILTGVFNPIKRHILAIDINLGKQKSWEEPWASPKDQTCPPNKYNINKILNWEIEEYKTMPDTYKSYKTDITLLFCMQAVLWQSTV